LYLIDFDKLMDGYVRPFGGHYFRYSDDILLIVPGNRIAGFAARDYAMSQIVNFGPEIKFKPQKTSMVVYTPDCQGHLTFKLVDGERGLNGLEHLDFRFDGRRIYLRDSTLSGFYRKITYSLRHEVRAFVARYPGKNADFLVENFNVEAFMKKFGRIEDYDPNSDYKDWTFAKRAAREFGPRGLPIYKQMRGHRELIVSRMHKEFDVALS